MFARQRQHDERNAHDRTNANHHPATVARGRAHHPPRQRRVRLHEMATVGGCGEFTGRVWRHLQRDTDGIRIEFDATIDGLVDASSNGLGSDPQRLRELAAVARRPQTSSGKQGAAAAPGQGVG